MKRIHLVLCSILLMISWVSAEEINRVGSTTASFLEIGMGSAPSAMGEAYVAMSGNLSSIYWNPAGVAYLEKSAFSMMYQPWMVDISTVFASSALVLPTIGTMAVSITQVDYGEMLVTNLENQDGTGEFFTASDFAVGLSYARKIANWFSFGATAKMINSKIWHESASAFAMDLGVIVKTQFFAPQGQKGKGLDIGMSISNYGTQMQYDGIDLVQPIDISLDETGNYGDVIGQFRTQAWELPLMFRIGLAYSPIQSNWQTLTLAVDALHPNNNAESINIGGEYALRVANKGKFYLRGGYKTLFLKESQFGLTGGGGVELFMMGNKTVIIDYAFKEAGLLGRTHAYTLGLTF